MLRTILLALALLAAPAFAKQVGILIDGPVTIAIYSERAHCPAGWARAVIDISGQATQGCYMQLGDQVFFVWDDGDAGRAPAKAFKRSDV